MKSLRLFIQLSRPHFLLGAALLFALGAGVARYMGVSLNWGLYLLGQAWVTSCQLGAHFLNEYFDGPADGQNQNRTPFSGGSGSTGPGKLPRQSALLAASTSFAVTAIFSMFLIQAGASLAVMFILLLSFLVSVSYSMPPIRLAASGYGELATSVLVANLVPATAFLLQTDLPLRFIAMSTFPLTALHLAMMLTFELPDYASDLKTNKRTLMIRLGWQNGMALHNLLILIAYLLLGLAAILGLPTFVALPAFLTLPIGLFQIWTMRRIAEGARPHWLSLTLTAVLLFGATAYLLAFRFWTY